MLMPAIVEESFCDFEKIYVLLSSDPTGWPEQTHICLHLITFDSVIILFIDLHIKVICDIVHLKINLTYT